MTLPTSQMTAFGAGIGAEASALLGFEARVGLVDDVDDALAAHELAVAVTRLERLERASDLHDLISGARTVGVRGFHKERADIRKGPGEVNVAGLGFRLSRDSTLARTPADAPSPSLARPARPAGRLRQPGAETAAAAARAGRPAAARRRARAAAPRRPPQAAAGSPVTPPAVSGDMVFDAWAADFYGQALKAGDPRATLLDREMAGLTPDPRVAARDSRQPEFSQPISVYIKGAVTEGPVANGERKRADVAAAGRHRAALRRAARDPDRHLGAGERASAPSRATST